MRNKLIILRFAFILVVFLGMTACTEYLDKEPEAEISSTEAFINFHNFQGFTEELYSLIPEFTSAVWACNWLFGDEILNSVGGIWVNDQFDKGNYWGWTGGSAWISYLDSGSPNNNPESTFDKGLWPNSWYAIRKANVGLENLEYLIDASEEEKDLIEGQLLFFRAWYHFQLMMYWGGMPYVDHVLPSGEPVDLPRLTYQECAEHAAEDFRAAADLLPVDWDNTTVGKDTKNQLRITKVMALAYLGKNYLYAGSPLMNKVSTGSATYNADYCQQAAAAFAEMLQYIDSGESFVHLVDSTQYEKLFYTDGGREIPGWQEAVFMSPVYSSWFNGCPWGPSSIFCDANIGGGYVSPNARYVENYGMANGLPIDDPASGYDPSDPWANRDPRFYNDIVIDGEQVIQGSAPADKEKYRYVHLHNFNNETQLGKSNLKSGRTGYLIKKLTPMTANDVDNFPNNYLHVAYMRLSDVYLMYAEAVLHGYGSATASHPGYITAEEAFNIVRTRMPVGAIDQKFVNDKDLFMSEIIRERAVELAFEANFRFHDLRRWMLAGEKKYLEKTAIDFDRDPNTGKPINMKERVLVTRPFEAKHYWLPLKISDVTLSESFQQNPGW